MSKKKDLKFPVSMGFVIEFALDKETNKTIFVLRSTGGNIIKFSTDKSDFLSKIDSLLSEILENNSDSDENS